MSGNGQLVHPQLGVPVKVYEYQRASGDVAFVNARFEPKDFRAAHPTPNGRWAWNLNGAPTLLYALPRIEQALREGETVWIVDGEKDADALLDRGVAATCCARAQGWGYDLVEQLIGVRQVRIVADSDESGIGVRQAEQVRDLLVETTGVASADIEIVRAAVGKDAFDHLAAGQGLNDFVPLAIDAEPLEAEPAPRLTFDSFDAFRKRTLPPADILVGSPEGTNLLPRFGWVMPWGPAGSGKTSILIDLVFHACAAQDWLGYPIEDEVRIVLVVNEGIPGALQRKLVQKWQAWPHDRDAIQRNLAVFVAPWGELTFRDEDMARELREFALEFAADYVALDPLHTVATVTAGAPDETEKFKHRLREFGVWNDLGVITAHHSNKLGIVSGDWARHPDTVFHVVKEPKLPATRFTLEKARPADPEELGVPCVLEWEVETFSYQRRMLDTTKTSDDELLERIKETLALATEPLSLNKVKERTKGDDDRLAEVARRAVESGEIANFSATEGWFKLVLPERGAEFDAPLPVTSQQSLLVEPEKRDVGDSGAFKSTFTESEVVGEVSLPLGSDPHTSPRLADDDNPFFDP